MQDARACGRDFELLVLPGRPDAACPECHGSNLERLLSAFAVSSDGTKHRNLQVARQKAATGRGRLDKQRSEQEYVRDHLADEGVVVPPLDKKKE